MNMKERFFPLLFKIADDKSKKSQNLFIYTNTFILFLLVFSSISSIFTPKIPAPNWIIILCTSCLIVSTFLNIYILFFRPEKSWYEGRAIAESVKTLTWKFITGTKPFKLTLDDKNVERLFNENLKKIIGQRKDFYVLIGKEYPDGNMISQEMVNLRKYDFEDRKFIYINDRIQNQINWYSKKSKENSLFKNITFGLIIGFQFLGVLFFILETNTSLRMSFTSLFITLTSVFMTWLQLKRYQELTDAYGITATELIFIKEKSKFVNDDNDLEKYVDDAETAISREHTLWLARRDNVELYN